MRLNIEITNELNEKLDRLLKVKGIKKMYYTRKALEKCILQDWQELEVKDEVSSEDKRQEPEDKR